jgi:transcriptional regulator with XRE-family HTH domain
MGGSPKKKAGLLIRRLRKGRRMSQQALAAAIGVHVNTVARWECAGIDPHHKALPLIAAALRLPAMPLARADLARLRVGRGPQRPVRRNGLNLAENGMGIEADGLREQQVFDYIDPSIAALYD